MQYKIGQRVRIRPDLTCKYYKTSNNDNLIVARAMLCYANTTQTIIKIRSDGRYTLEESAEWVWCDEMLLPLKITTTRRNKSTQS